MSIDINVVSHISNKSYTVVDNTGNIVTQNTSNNIVNIPFDTSYIIYIEPELEELTYTGLLDLSTGLLSGIYGYIFVIMVGVLFYYLIKMVKQYV